MKLLTFVAFSAIATTTIPAFANTSAFTMQNENVETQACYTAATQGLDAAKAFLKSNDVNYFVFKETVVCNGMQINEFARKYHRNNAQRAPLEVVSLNAENQSPESLLCVDAVSMGERKARIKHSMQNVSVRCNGKTITQFLRALKASKIVKKNDKENTIASL